MKNIIKINSGPNAEYPSKFDAIFIEDSLHEVMLLDNLLAKLFPALNCGWIQNAKILLELLKLDTLPKSKVMFLDIKMPDISGLECLEIIKSEYQNYRTPIVMLSSSEHAKDMQRAYELSCNGFLVKDANLADFREKMTMAIMYWTKMNTIK